MEEIEDIERRGFERRNFFQNIKLSSFGELKNCIGGGFLGVREGSYKFFKFNICSYNILKIKNILTISVNLSLFKKNTF